MIIQSKRVWFDETFRPLQLEVVNDKITKIMPYNHVKADKDYGDRMITPGLIDIHNHGYNGNDTNHATEEWLKEWMAYLPTEGVTATVPSTSSASQENILKGLQAVANVIDENPKGTKILGIYSEGPFVSDKFHGAQDLQFKVVPTKETYDVYQKAARGHLIYVMVAPEELDENMTFIRYCVANGTVVALGHTGAKFEVVAKAREAGAKAFTHTFNGMLGLHHREPGTVGAAMYFDDMLAEIIGDGVHVNKVVANILAKVKGKDKLITVTDSVQIKGLPAGERQMKDRFVIIGEDGVGRLPDGTLAGSSAKLNMLLKHQIESAGISVVTAINSVTCNPALLLNFGHKKGYLRVGYDADLAVFNDDYTLKQTYVMGEEML
ncbi:N-acetylglucosamine-6-phosphate deacetylase [bioreactor metagenome]|uniref:N-acetylglucosamine-6-phosphate deacetylase n=1 Tax=bioreactor metagenome TaxID=1076179 RepID=A0A645C544_9ZZZZ